MLTLSSRLNFVFTCEITLQPSSNRSPPALFSSNYNKQHTINIDISAHIALYNRCLCFLLYSTAFYLQHVIFGNLYS